MILIYQIAIKPYLLKYVEYYNPVDPYFSLTDKSKIGSVLISYLKPKLKLTVTETIGNEADFVALKIAVPSRYQNKYGAFISYDNQLRFNEYLRKDFIEKMCEHVWANHKPQQPNIYNSLLQFRLRFNITEDELAFKTMQKWWERAGKKSCA